MPLITFGVIHPFTPVLIIGVIIIGYCIFLVCKGSRKFEKIVKKTIEDETTIKTTHVINNIADAEDALSERAVEQRKQAKNLEKDSSAINGFLESRTNIKDSDTKEGTPME